MVKVGMEWLPAFWMTFAVYSGTSQLAVLPLLAGRPAWAAALAGAAVSLATLDWPHRVGTVVAVLAGVLAALWAGRDRPWLRLGRTG